MASMIFLDHNATAPLRPQARAALEAWLQEDGWGNPSSVHSQGRSTRERVELAREQVARLLGTRPSRLVFTSGATESNNAAVRHWSENDSQRPLLVATRMEHPSLLEPLRRRESFQSVEWIPVSAAGELDLESLPRLPEDRVGMIACMAANNETGIRLPWREVAAWGSQRQIPVHVDLTQVVGKEHPLDLDASGAASASLSGHKLGALAGCGVLWSRHAPMAFLHGGPQERDLRAGTENLAGIITLGAACQALLEHGAQEHARLKAQGEWFRRRLQSIPGVRLTVPAGSSLDGTVHLRLPVDAETVLIRLDMAGVCVSMGSACSAGALKPSETLLAMGWSRQEAKQALRLSLGWNTTDQELETAAQHLERIVAELSKRSDPANL